jgi:hypothetical protein
LELYDKALDKVFNNVSEVEVEEEEKVKVSFKLPW